jgi:hypothetical protein
LARPRERGANPSLSDPTSHQTLRGGASKGGEDRVSHHPEGKNGWGGGRSAGAQSLPVRSVSKDRESNQPEGGNITSLSFGRGEQLGCSTDGTVGS